MAGSEKQVATLGSSLKTRWGQREAVRRSQSQENRLKSLLSQSKKVLKENVSVIKTGEAQNQMSDRIVQLEGEKAQLQAQISNLNSSLIALKNEQGAQSDNVLEAEKKVKEKEQVITELGALVKSQQAAAVGVERGSEA